MKSFRIAAMALTVAAAFQTIEAKVRLPQVISDCMVIQRDAPVKVWGWADPGEKVTVRFDGKHWFTQAGDDGRWSVAMDPHPAGGPYLLEVNEKIIRDVLVGDVWLLSGQSNQETPVERLVDRYPEIPVSNNHMVRMYKVPTSDRPGEPQADIPQGERWHSAISSDVMNWKALAYFYAMEAYEKTGVPQGMMVSSLGGSRIESWIPEDRLLAFPQIARMKEEALASENAAADRGQLEGWHREDYDDSLWDSVMEPAYLSESGIERGVVWFRKEIDVPQSMDGRHARILMGRLVDGDEVYVNGTLVGSTSYFGPPRKYDIPAGVLHEGRNVVAVRLTANAGDAGFVPDKPYRIVADEAEIDLTGSWKYRVGRTAARRQPGAFPGAPRRGFTGAGLFNGMVNPLKDYSFCGVIWYQGESNASEAAAYEGLLGALVESWREFFSSPDLPVLICQLPNYMDKYDHPTDSDWARLREAQLKVFRSTPRTGLVVGYDTGEYNDIHPLNKKDLAKRLFLWTRQLCYGEKVVASGPVYEGMKIEGDRIVLSFSSTGGGLRSRDGALRHFAIAGEDGRFVWADAVIKGNTVVVSSPEVPYPVAVRYAWADNPDEANLINREGLLASPFRTDERGYEPNNVRMNYTN